MLPLWCWPNYAGAATGEGQQLCPRIRAWRDVSWLFLSRVDFFSVFASFAALWTAGCRMWRCPSAGPSGGEAFLLPRMLFVLWLLGPLVTF